MIFIINWCSSNSYYWIRCINVFKYIINTGCFVNDFNFENVKRFYQVENHRQGFIRAWHGHKKEGKYILGKATNLTNRLSVYNKTDDYEVVYYQSCLDEETMTLAEKCVFLKLKNYRQQANRERFILPSDQTIDVFINIIKDTIEFLK